MAIVMGDVGGGRAALVCGLVDRRMSLAALEPPGRAADWG